MDSAARDFPPGDFRVSDADRDRALAELGEAFRVGRLTADEFDERAGQALSARTGKELTVLLADLPVDRAPATVPAAAERGLRVLSARRVVMVSAGLAAISCAAIAAANALVGGATVGRAASVHIAVQGGGGVSGVICPAATGNTCLELIQEMAARNGQIPLPVPPDSVTTISSPGFDWAATVTPAAIAVLLVVLIIFMSVSRARRA
ncbi:MAG TPA: DUF1707 domain-containing protein [Streptosporangiaceae bacterium]|nr:DUF1707 domain-containing protein [Streptosporangiaceae bacterium]